MNEVRPPALAESLAAGLGPPPADQMLTARQLADLLGLKNLRTVQRWVARYKLPRIRIGKLVRFPWPELRARLIEVHGQGRFPATFKP